MDSRPTRNPRRPGFTLMELLVVVALIGILATVIAFGLGGTRGAALGSAQRAVMATVTAAKAHASLEGVKARLIVYADTNSAGGGSTTVNAKKLRYYGIIYQAKDTDPNSPTYGQVIDNTWVAATDAFLPGGIYFVPSANGSYSKEFVRWVPDGLDSAIGKRSSSDTATVGTMTLDGFPLETAKDNAGGDSFYYIEFKPSGIFVDSGPPRKTYANIVVGAATQDGPASITFKPANENADPALSGVQVRYLGGVVPFNELADIISQ